MSLKYRIIILWPAVLITISIAFIWYAVAQSGRTNHPAQSLREYFPDKIFARHFILEDAEFIISCPSHGLFQKVQLNGAIEMVGFNSGTPGNIYFDATNFRMTSAPFFIPQAGRMITLKIDMSYAYPTTNQMSLTTGRLTGSSHAARLYCNVTIDGLVKYRIMFNLEGFIYLENGRAYLLATAVAEAPKEIKRDSWGDGCIVEATPEGLRIFSDAIFMLHLKARDLYPKWLPKNYFTEAAK